MWLLVRPRYTELTDQSGWASISHIIDACAPLIDGLGHAITSRGFGQCQFLALERCHIIKIGILFFMRLYIYSTEAFGIALRPPRARIVVDTHTQTNYCNPCCACAPRVNDTAADDVLSIGDQLLLSFTEILDILWFVYRETWKPWDPWLKLSPLILMSQYL